MSGSAGTVELGIGDVACASDMSVRTVRYYDDLGLITASRRVGGKRRFDPETVGRLHFIRRGREAGFSLDEIRFLLDDRAGGWQTVVAGKLADLRAQRERLDETIATLDGFLSCGCAAVADCPQVR